MAFEVVDEPIAPSIEQTETKSWEECVPPPNLKMLKAMGFIKEPSYPTISGATITYAFADGKETSVKKSTKRKNG